MARESKKPDIAALIKVFEQYSTRAFIAMEKGQVNDWLNARKDLKDQLDIWGVSDLFDWGER